jgi:hypothetical protein
MEFAWLMQDHENTITRALMTPAGRSALRVYQMGLSVLAREEGTNPLPLIEQAGNAGFPLDHLAMMAFWAEDIDLVFDIRQVAGMDWSKWKRTPLFPPLTLTAKEDPQGHYRQRAAEEKALLRESPLVLPEMGHDPVLVGRLLQDPDFSPTEVFKRKGYPSPADNLFVQAISQANNGPDSAQVAELLWQDGRVRKDAHVLRMAFAVLSPTVWEDDRWFDRLWSLVPAETLYAPCKMETRFGILSTRPLAIGLLASAEYANPKRWKKLKTLNWSALPEEETKAMLDYFARQIRTGGPDHARLPHRQDMARVLFSHVHAGRSWNTFVFKNICRIVEQKAIFHGASCMDKAAPGMSLAEVRTRLLEQDPIIQGLVKKGATLSSRPQGLCFWSEEHVQKWLPFVDPVDRTAVEALCEKAQGTVMPGQSLEESALARRLLFGLPEATHTRAGPRL